ncbi:MAG: SusF/SusE family outer membrane protein [Bacteroidaceae bacterium]|nr:SusF/SusE family outer membrane protein [Bacteroidaceae bacterium]
MKKLLITLLLAAAVLPGWADEYYLVGSATECGWNTGEWQRSTVRATQTGTDTWVAAVRLTAGEGDTFKIPNGADEFDNNGIWATSEGQTLTSNWQDFSTTNDGDKQFRVAEEGMYLVSFNTSTKKIKAEKLTEPSKEGDYFLISNLNDYWYFAAYIASGNTNTAKARLTTDLTFDGNFVCMASDKFKFKGEFDGNNHTIDYAVATCAYGRVGLFTYVANGANIHNLIIGANSSFTGVAKVGGIAGFARDGGEVTLTNVINKANITSTGDTDANAAGLIGCATDRTKITATNCANTGTITGQGGQCAAFAGWTQDRTTFTNCWNSGTITTALEGNAELYRNSGSVLAINCYNLTEQGDQGTRLASTTAASGELCFKLNSKQTDIKWFQNLTGTVDNIPLPFSTHSQVYANSSNCDGSSASGYSNDPSSMPSHNFADGYCTVCNSLHEAYLTPDGEGYYTIGTANDLHWFADYVKEVNAKAKAKLTANIDYTSYKQGFIGTSQSLAYCGTFDGQGHTITIDIVNNGTTDRTGLFAYINSATIRNLVVEGSATSAGNNCVGGLGGRSDNDGTLIENVVVRTAVSYTGSNGDATCGGLFANMEAQVTLKNCAFLGSINAGTAEGNGGLVGWAGSGNNNKYINCLVAPVEYTQNGNSGDFSRNNPTVTNCHKVASNDAKLVSGELCYKLNGNQSGGADWYQTLGTDATPLPFNTSQRVFYGSDHTPNYYNYGLVNDKIQIANMEQLRDFSNIVNAGATTVNAELTADITMASENQYGYTPIGSTDHPYTGHFNGQGHSVTLNINNPGYNYQGLFGVITDGVLIEKVIVKGTVIGNDYVGGIAGGTNGGSSNAQKTDIWYCGNEATITAKGANGAGIIGVNQNGSASIILLNCYNTGDVTSNREGGAMSGWLGGGWSNVRNCYNSGTIKNGENTSKAFGRNNGCYFTNCYYTEGSGTDNSTENHDNGQITEAADATLASGELCYLLNGDQSEIAFYQSLGDTDTYPTIDFNKPKVYQLSVGEHGYASFVPTVNIASLPEGVTVYAGQNNGTSLHLEEVTEVPADNAFVVKAAEGNYYYNNTSVSITLSVANDLTYSDEAIVSDGTQYCLANKTSGVGFYKVQSGITIPARKAYLAVTAGIKEFYGFDDDATGISDLNVNDNLNGAIYNLAGQRINKVQKGINIINGKKVLF